MLRRAPRLREPPIIPRSIAGGPHERPDAERHAEADPPRRRERARRPRAPARVRALPQDRARARGRDALGDLRRPRDAPRPRVDRPRPPPPGGRDLPPPEEPPDD